MAAFKSVARDRDCQIERALRMLLLVAAGGLALIEIGGIARVDLSGRHPDLSGSLRFIAVGALSGLTAGVTGAALGLLFGLPRAQPVAVTPVVGTAGSEDWYTDGTAMEQIVDWLTKIIVGVTLTQWWAISDQFDRLATATSLGMGLEGASGAAADGVKVVGGMILLGYAVLGFALAYLWARRYLGLEFTLARAGSRAAQIQQQRRFLDRANAANTLQQGEKNDGAFDEAVRAMRETRTSGDGDMPCPLIEPGRERSDDPWFNQFGGRASRNGLSLTATVEELAAQPDNYAVNLRLTGDTLGRRKALVKRQARFYLHPTFPNAIRTLAFDETGEIKLPLVAYGGFTVGVQLDDDETLLELRLSDDPEFPKPFRDA